MSENNNNKGRFLQYVKHLMGRGMTAQQAYQYLMAHRTSKPSAAPPPTGGGNEGVALASAPPPPTSGISSTIHPGGASSLGTHAPCPPVMDMTPSQASSSRSSGRQWMPSGGGGPAQLRTTIGASVIHALPPSLAYVRQPSQSQFSGLMQPPLSVQTFQGRAGTGDTGEADDDFEEAVDEILYSAYRPKKLKMGLPHPDPVVENASLAAVDPPDVTYQLHMPPNIGEEGLLSDLQLEAIVYACQRHEVVLSSGERAGYFIGDGAGIGKGRQLAGILVENWIQGRKKSIWISVSVDLKFDAERDLQDLGFNPTIPVHSLHKFGYSTITETEGVVFCTYSALVARASDKSRRLDQLVEWFGADYDGCLFFDECHKAKNLFASGRAASKSGQAVIELQQKLSKARVVYCSATGATEPRNLGYMSRLGLWGPGSPFPLGFSEFLEVIEGRGTGSMEVVAMTLKQIGAFCSRTLSFEGCRFDIVEGKLTPEMEIMYNRVANLWQKLTRELTEKLQKDGAVMASALDVIDVDEEEEEVEDEDPDDEDGGGEKKTRRKRSKKASTRDVWRYFWGTHQRFFRDLCVACKVPVAVEQTRQALKEGKCVVIGLQSTGEARAREIMKERKSQQVEDFLSAPKATLENLVRKLFSRPKKPPEGAEADPPKSSKRKKRSRAVAMVNEEETPTGEGDDEEEEGGVVEMEESGFEDGPSCEMSGTLGGKAPTKRPKVTSRSPTKKKESSGVKGKGQRSRQSSVAGSEAEASDSRSSPGTGWYLMSSPVKEEGNQEAAASSESASDSGTKNILRFRRLPSNQDLNSVSTKTEVDTGAVGTPPVPVELSGSEGSGIPAPANAIASPDKPCTNTLNDRIDQLLEEIQNLSMPGNPLDTLIDEFGGPEHVSEMTGRASRLVRDSGTGKIVWESRSKNGVSLEMQNIHEKESFMKGDKLVAIISEAASSGISLQADRRAVNQRRRVHITLELPWAADRAVQQLGRTHRSNQQSAPEYRLLISSAGGERRFASAVARRLECMGALTQGDRRATGSAKGFQAFNLENKYGQRALEAVFDVLRGKSSSVVPLPDLSEDEMLYVSSRLQKEKQTMMASASSYSWQALHAVQKHSQDLSFRTAARLWLQDVGIDVWKEGVTKGPGTKRIDVARFLNRLLGLQLPRQASLFSYFLQMFDATLRQAKRDGEYDDGILEIRGRSVRFVGHSYQVCCDPTWSLTVLLSKAEVDRGVSWDKALELHTEAEQEANETKASEGEGDPTTGSNLNGFWVAKHSFSGRVLVLLALVKYDVVSGGMDSRCTYRIYRPATGEHDMPRQVLLDRYRRVTPEEAKITWEEDYIRSARMCMHGPSCRQGPACESGKRVRVLYILSGALLSIWGRVEECLSQHMRNKKPSLKIIRVVETAASNGSDDPTNGGSNRSSPVPTLTMEVEKDLEVASVPEQLSHRKQILGIQIPMNLVRPLVDSLRNSTTHPIPAGPKAMRSSNPTPPVVYGTSGYFPSPFTAHANPPPVQHVPTTASLVQQQQHLQQQHPLHHPQQQQLQQQQQQQQQPPQQQQALLYHQHYQMHQGTPNPKQGSFQLQPQPYPPGTLEQQAMTVHHNQEQPPPLMQPQQSDVDCSNQPTPTC